MLRMWEVFHESEGRREIVLGFLKSVYGVCFLLFFFFFFVLLQFLALFSA